MGRRLERRARETSGRQKQGALAEGDWTNEGANNAHLR